MNMRLIYLIGAVVVFLLILIFAMPQIGSTCVWYLIPSNSNPTFVLFQATGLGAVLGGLLVLFWKNTDKKKGDEDGEDSDDTPR